jgi:hypothetical protein
MIQRRSGEGVTMQVLTRLAGTGLCLALVGCGGDSSTGPPSLLLALSTGSVSFVGVQGGNTPAPQSIAITNGGTGLLTGLAVGPITYGGGSGWLGASLDKTTAPATLTLSVTAGGLSSGAYTATLPISAHGASNSPQQLAVRLLVLGGAGVTTLAAPGQSVAFLDSPNIGTQLTLQAGAQYLVAVVNTNPSYAITEDFTLAGALVAGGPVSRVASPVAAVPSDQVTRYVPPAQAGGPTFAASRAGFPKPALIRRFAQNHLKMLEQNRQLYATFVRQVATHARLQARTARIAPLRASISQTVGTVNKVYVRHPLSFGCATVDSIGARTVAVGQHVIVLADTNLTDWPEGQRPDSSFYQSFADEYDQVTWPHTQNYIGDPLAYDSQLSGVGKVTVTITPVLNLHGNIGGQVNPCDFLPFAGSGPGPIYSNETEMFYAATPGPDAFPVDIWQKVLRGAVAAHETKHIVSFADRIVNNSPTLEQVWLEEGLAQVSSEIWGRHFNQATWKGHAAFSQTVACELNLGAAAPCNAQGDKPINLVLTHLPYLFLYLQNESESNSEGLGKDDLAIYGAGWALARWATDQYAGTEGSFIKSLINEPVLTGLENLSSHTGQPTPLLLLYWNLASAIYDTPTYTAADPRTTIPSFNFAEIFQVGQTGFTCGGTPCGLFTDSGLPVYPVQPVALSSGPITQTATAVPGTAASFFLLSSATSGTQAMQLLSGTGATLSPSSGLRVGIIRVK